MVIPKSELSPEYLRIWCSQLGILRTPASPLSYFHQRSKGFCSREHLTGRGSGTQDTSDPRRSVVSSPHSSLGWYNEFSFCSASALKFVNLLPGTHGSWGRTPVHFWIISGCPQKRTHLIFFSPLITISIPYQVRPQCSPVCRNSLHPVPALSSCPLFSYLPVNISSQMPPPLWSHVGFACLLAQLLQRSHDVVESLLDVGVSTLDTNYTRFLAIFVPFLSKWQ